MPGGGGVGRRAGADVLVGEAIERVVGVAARGAVVLDDAGSIAGRGEGVGEGGDGVADAVGRGEVAEAVAGVVGVGRRRQAARRLGEELVVAVEGARGRDAALVDLEDDVAARVVVELARGA